MNQDQNTDTAILEIQPEAMGIDEYLRHKENAAISNGFSKSFFNRANNLFFLRERHKTAALAAVRDGKPLHYDAACDYLDLKKYNWHRMAGSHYLILVKSAKTPEQAAADKRMSASAHSYYCERELRKCPPVEVI